MDSSISNTECSIALANETKTGSQLNEEFKSLIERINKILCQTEFDLNNGEYIYKEHCNELRRQVQLAKETQILKIEELTDNLMNEIDKFEKESLEMVLKVNKEQLVNKLNEMKQENEKWNERLDEFKVDNQMLNQLRDSLSKIAVERDNFKCLLHKKMMKFKEYKDQSFVGELSQVSLDSFDQIPLQKQIEEIEKGYFLEDDYTGLNFDFSFQLREGKILSNGDLLLCGEITDDFGSCHDVVLAVFDLNKDFRLKKIKQLCVNYYSMETSSDKICLANLIKERSMRYLGREETEDDKEYEETNDKAGDYIVLILNENLEKLHRFKTHRMQLIGANDSFLFFTDDSKHKDDKVSFYTWSKEFVRSIGQSNDPNLPFYFPCNISKFVNMFGRYYFICRYYKDYKNHCEFRIIDEETGILLKEINEADDFCFENDYNIILSKHESIQYLSFDSEFLREVQMKHDYNSFLLNYDKRCFTFNRRYNQLCFWNKYDENTHEVI